MEIKYTVNEEILIKRGINVNYYRRSFFQMKYKKMWYFFHNCKIEVVRIGTELWIFLQPSSHI